MAQTLLPIADIAADSVTLTGGATAHAVLADSSNATYCTWDNADDTVICTLSSPIVTPVAGAHVLRWRSSALGDFTDYPTLTIGIYLESMDLVANVAMSGPDQGEIFQWATGDGIPSDFSYTLSADEVALITSYENLILQIVAGNAYGTLMSIQYALFEVPAGDIEQDVDIEAVDYATFESLVTEAGPSRLKAPETLEAETTVPARVFSSIRAGHADWKILQHLDAAAAALGVTSGQLKAAHATAHSRVWGRAPSTANNKPALQTTHLLARPRYGSNL